MCSLHPRSLHPNGRISKKTHPFGGGPCYTKALYIQGAQEEDNHSENRSYQLPLFRFEGSCTELARVTPTTDTTTHRATWRQSTCCLCCEVADTPACANGAAQSIARQIKTSTSTPVAGAGCMRCLWKAWRPWQQPAKPRDPCGFSRLRVEVGRRKGLASTQAHPRMLMAARATTP